MTNCHLMETQNLVISFDYSWFLAKNFAYAECRIMKFHYRNSSTLQWQPFGEVCSLFTGELKLHIWGNILGEVQKTGPKTPKVSFKWKPDIHFFTRSLHLTTIAGPWYFGRVHCKCLQGFTGKVHSILVKTIGKH